MAECVRVRRKVGRWTDADKQLLPTDSRVAQKVRDYIPLARSVADRFIRRFPWYVDAGCVFSAAMNGLWRAAQDPDIEHFASAAKAFMRREIMHVFRRQVYDSQRPNRRHHYPASADAYKDRPGGTDTSALVESEDWLAEAERFLEPDDRRCLRLLSEPFTTLAEAACDGGMSSGYSLKRKFRTRLADFAASNS